MLPMRRLNIRELIYRPSTILEWSTHIVIAQVAALLQPVHVVQTAEIVLRFAITARTMMSEVDEDLTLLRDPTLAASRLGAGGIALH